VSTLAWHFVGGALRDGRPVPEDGETLVHDGPVKMCASGLHASRRMLDALTYAPGYTVCRVRCEDVVAEDYDKLVCRRRTILWRVEAEDLLRDFARRCALDVIDEWDAPDVVIEYLRTGDESLRSATRSAARDAVRSAARGATRPAARLAARLAAWAAAWDRQNRRLTAMVSARKPEAA